MKALLEIHILQNYAPSNLNRDDTGSPKNAVFGGYKRARISSQSFKYAARRYVDDLRELLPEDRATRTRRIAKPVADELIKMDVKETEATKLARMAIDSLLKTDEKNDGDDHLAKVLVFFTAGEAREMAQVLHKNFADLQSLISEEGEKTRERLDEIEKSLGDINTKLKEDNSDEKQKELEDEKKDLGSEKRKLERQKFKPDDEIVKQLKAAFGKGKRAVDLALFGRMLAEIPRKERDDAACQVAHPISTNAIEPQFDFYTAVDELKPDEDTGAGMMGTLEFNSACYYRYANIDLEQLKENLSERKGEGKSSELIFDLEQFKRGLKAFLQAFANAKPGGKQNSHAAHNEPEYIVFTVRQGAAPRNLANAFEKPVWVPRGKTEHSLTELSIKRFEDKWKRLAGGYGMGSAHKTFVFNLTDVDSELSRLSESHGGQYLTTDSLNKLVDKTLSASLDVLNLES